MASQYKVQVGNTIRDVCINGSGSMLNWDNICLANEFDTWTPDLTPGLLVIIPDTASIDANTFADKQGYPASNTNKANALAILAQVFDILTDRWILKNGSWDDNGIWIDTDIWIDNP